MWSEYWLSQRKVILTSIYVQFYLCKCLLCKHEQFMIILNNRKSARISPLNCLKRMNTALIPIFYLQSQLAEGQQVTITLQHHGQLEPENFAQITDTYHHHHHHPTAFIDPLFRPTTETFKIKPVSFSIQTRPGMIFGQTR